MTNIDFLIIGAGSAGLTAAMYAARSRISTIVIDSSGSGGQVLQIADLENYPGIFPAINGYEIAEKMQKQAESFGAKVIQTQVSSIKKEDDLFTVETEKETTVMRMSKADFVELIDTDPVLRRNFIATLSNIDVFLTKKMRVLSLFTVREKVSYFLKEASGKQGSNVVLLDKSRQESAESFGIQKFSLLRTMSELQEAGAIRVECKRITILDRSKL